ncbi:MAG: YheU family protein [Spongiibacteraceae bacterium]|jgi:uncharacterized protein YheU (UPF0270 family)|nr:YheU family protein [Spongiibacteraceae bacterium]
METPPPFEVTEGVLVVPAEQLAPDTLQAVIEAFISREGTDYGEVEVSLATKVAQVRRALEQREVFLMFDPISESCSIVPREAVPPALRYR